MNDEELCKLFGTNIEEVEREVGKVEAGDYSSFDFSRVAMDGKARGQGEDDHHLHARAGLPHRGNAKGHGGAGHHARGVRPPRHRL